MRAIAIPIMLLLVPMLPAPPAGAVVAECVFVPVPYSNVCVDPEGHSCFDVPEGIEGCAGADGSFYVSDAPSHEYHCEEQYPEPNCCPYWQGCEGEEQIACVDEVSGPFWQVGTAGSYASVWVSHWCYFLHCDFQTYCPYDRRLMYRVPLVDAPVG